ncbi:SAM-dependent methyltransferase [Streptomyces sp. NPDC059740]|uniref:SAM-dependent methyltransferase n=1 Tax=Streptomyces sp. NPDC059740 TaxID=3346926 RepID=UPI0036576EFD
MSAERGFAPEEIDTGTAHTARMYDYFLGGRDNYEVDRVAAERAMEVVPYIKLIAEANRAFLRRAVRTVVAAGVRQVIDLGTGIPTSPNTHEVAREVAPDTRVVYVDNDPIVATHAGARLTNTPGTGFVLADIREPESVLESPVVRELIDFDQPVAVCMFAVLHFVGHESDPAGIVRTLTADLAPGSMLAMSHGTTEPYFPVAGQENKRDEIEEVYETSNTGLALRSRQEIAALFGPFALLEPGLVPLPLWRPDGAEPSREEAARIGLLAGVGRKG